MRPINLLLLVAVAAAVVGCGSTEDPQSTPTAVAESPAETTRDQTPVTDDAPDVEAAEAAARDALPDVPYWEGTTFKGTVIGDAEVCVTRTVKEAIGEGGRRSHVIVSWPGLELGEPQDGPCSKRAETADRKIEDAREFYLRMDDLAIELDEAASDAQDGNPGAVAEVARLRETIDRTNERYLLGGGEMSTGGNLLASAATTLSRAAEDGDVAEMADQRAEIADARNKLAEEAVG